MTESGPTAVSMRDLLASCEAAKAVSRAPRAPEERPEGARGCAEDAAADARARPVTTDPQANDVPSQHPTAA